MMVGNFGLYFFTFLTFVQTSCASIPMALDPYSYVVNHAEFAKQKGTSRFYLDLTNDGILDLFAGEQWSGNSGGPYYVFLRSKEGYRPAGEIFLHPEAIEVLKTSHFGIQDIQVYHHLSADHGDLQTYEYDGNGFKLSGKKRVNSAGLEKVLHPAKLQVLESSPGESWK
jgi:hypothetical protein